jgi:methyl-accepting chemotaxis protein
MAMRWPIYVEFLMSEIDSLSRTQMKATRLLGQVCIVGAFLPSIVAYLVGNQWLVALASGLAVAVLVQISLRGAQKLARLAVTAGVIGITALVTAAFAGHPWQIDSHMLYFASLAALVLLLDVRALLLATVLILVHHIGLTLLMPGLVYPSFELLANLERSVFHAVVVAVEVSALIYAVHVRLGLIKSNKTAHAEALKLLEETAKAKASADASSEAARLAQTQAEDAKLAAEDALARAEFEAERAKAADAETIFRAQEEQARQQETAIKVQETVNRLRVGLKHLADGDLNVEIGEAFAAEYEDLRHAFNHSVDELSHAFKSVLSESDLILGDTIDIAQSSEVLARRTEEQANTLAQITSSTEKLKNRISDAARNSHETSQTVAKTRESAKTTTNTVHKAVQSMGAIEASSNQIEKITGVIDEISFQTNLLALNAGVEAARAGEAGRGFAVVASEVRALAQRSSDAAREINDIIARSGEEIRKGVKLVRDTGAAIEDIQAAVESISNDTDNIADGTSKQAEDVESITAALSDLDAITQQNAARFEETSAATQSLESSSHKLNDTIKAFFELEGPRSDNMPAARSA